MITKAKKSLIFQLHIYALTLYFEVSNYHIRLCKDCIRIIKNQNQILKIFFLIIGENQSLIAYQKYKTIQSPNLQGEEFAIQVCKDDSASTCGFGLIPRIQGLFLSCYGPWVNTPLP